MGIEVGRRIGLDISGFVSEGPARGFSSLASLGPELRAPSVFMNDGSVKESIGGFSPVGKIVFNKLGNYEVKAASDVISEAESILAEANSQPVDTEVPSIFKTGLSDIDLDPTIKSSEIKPVIEPVIFPKVEPSVDYLPKPTTVTFPVSEPAIKIETTLVTQPAIQPQTDSKVSIQQEVIEEKILAEELKSELTEETAEYEDSYLEDERVSEQRRYEIKEAIKKAKLRVILLGLKKIPGWLVAKFLPPEHSGNRSQVVKKKGPDGSYQETVEAIALTGEFTSEQEAEKISSAIIAEKTPVKKGQHGRRVGNVEVARVFKYHFVKPVASEIMQKRTVKKVVQSFGQNQAQVVEGSLADYPKLAEVFNKAA